METFVGTLKLIIGLWWLWFILVGPALILLAIELRQMRKTLFVGMVVFCGIIYLALTPVQYLQINPPDGIQPSPPTIGENGLPVADKFKFNPLPGFYEAVNYFFIPTLKTFWYIWVPGWLLVLVSAYLNPEQKKKRRRRA